MDGGDFSACLNSDRYADVVTANMQLGSRMGVSGTPTIMVNADGNLRRLNTNDFQSIPLLEKFHNLCQDVGLQ